MTTCLHCHATTSNGLALCELCQRFALGVFEMLPIYFRNLARWKPGRAGSRPVPGSRVLYSGETQGDGTGDRISDRLDETTTALTTWARALVKDRPHFPHPLTFADAVLTGDLADETADMLADEPAKVTALLCSAFELHLTSIATLDWCGVFVAEIGQHEERLRALTETAAPGWYGGECGRCKAPTYVVPGLTWVTCRMCGLTTHAQDHLDAIREEAQGWIARPRALAEAAVALVDTEESVPRLHARIRQWEQRGRIQPIRRTARDHVYDSETDAIVVVEVEVGHPRYLFGDVLALVYRETRASDIDAEVS